MKNSFRSAFWVSIQCFTRCAKISQISISNGPFCAKQMVKVPPVAPTKIRNHLYAASPAVIYATGATEVLNKLPKHSQSGVRTITNLSGSKKVGKFEAGSFAGCISDLVNDVDILSPGDNERDILTVSRQSSRVAT